MPSQKVTLITGASSGIGAELARVFAAHGHRVALVARRIELLDEVATKIVAAGGAQPLMVACDLAQPGACAVVAASLQAENAEIEILVNNAGFGMFGRAADMPLAEQLKMIDLNVRAVTELTLCFAPTLIGNRGSILNVSSIAAFLPGPGMAVYYASKAYVLSLTEALHAELGPKGVRVTALCPGPVPTEFQARAGFAPGVDSAILGVTAAKVAELGYRGLKKGKRLVLPGLGIRLIPFFLRFAPRGLVLAAVNAIQLKR